MVRFKNRYYLIRVAFKGADDDETTAFVINDSLTSKVLVSELREAVSSFQCPT